MVKGHLDKNYDLCMDVIVAIHTGKSQKEIKACLARYEDAGGHPTTLWEHAENFWDEHNAHHYACRDMLNKLV